MDEIEYQRQLADLRTEWGGVFVNPEKMPGVVRTKNDPLTGILVGTRAKLFAEIINRALDGVA